MGCQKRNKLKTTVCQVLISTVGKIEKDRKHCGSLVDALLKRVVTEELSDTRHLRLQQSEPCGCEGRIFWLEERASAQVPELRQRVRESINT